MATATIAAPDRVTPEEFEELPGNERFELIDGELIERPDMGMEAAAIADETTYALKTYAKTNGGRGFGDGTPYRGFGLLGNDILKPDASYIAAGRLDEIPVGNCDIAPDLAVEVVSPSDNANDVQDKAAEYLRCGVRVVWIVYPTTRQVHAVREEGDVRVFRVGDELTCEDVLPGFAVPVASLFPTAAEAVSSPE